MKRASHRPPVATTVQFIAQKVSAWMEHPLNEKNMLSPTHTAEAIAVLRALIEKGLKNSPKMSIIVSAKEEECNDIGKAFLHESEVKGEYLPMRSIAIEINIRQYNLAVIQYGEIPPFTLCTVAMYEGEVPQAA